MKRTGLYSISAVAFVLAAMLSACSIDERIEIGLPQSGSGHVTLCFVSDPMQKIKVTTKASDPKEEDEKRINTLHVFFFDEYGEYLTGGYLKGYTDAPGEGGYYSPGEGSTILKIAQDQFDDPVKASKAIVYAVANVRSTTFQLGTDGRPENIRNMSDLEELIYRPSEDASVQIPYGDGMPMAGRTLETINLTDPDGTSNENAEERTIELKALMARIDVNISLASDITDGELPSFRLMDWTVNNLPVGCRIKELVENEFTPTLGDDKGTVTIPSYSTSPIYNHNGEISFSFYMLENVQEKKTDNPEWQEMGGSYPDSITDAQKQRYKPYLADKDNATSIELHGFYTTYNNQTYEVRYTLYLGANHTDDFKVRRNHQYKNDITIKGITTQNSSSGEYTLDARVEVDVENNDFYIAILRERNHDAHFCVTPMDVYMFKEENSPKVVVRLDASADTPDGIPWLRMEKISAEDMENGTVSASGFTAYSDGGSHLATDTSWNAGNGKRAFFTTDLVTKTLKNNTEIEVTQSRDRIYFYLDENLSDTDNRTATVTLDYYEKDSEGNESLVRSRTLEITQVHFLKVQVYGRTEVGTGTYRHNQNGYIISEDEYNRLDWRDKFSYSQVMRSVSDLDNPYEEIGGVIYMEQYEEYLDHYDPLDTYDSEQLYPGLEWAKTGSGLDNTELYQLCEEVSWFGPIGEYEDPVHIYLDGLEYTGYAIWKSNQQLMDLNERPLSAFQYCHNKNKRNTQGYVPSTYYDDSYSGILDTYYYGVLTENKGKYFLPGIRQMEDALTQYYSSFPEFQGNYYWSSAVATASGGDTQNNSRARATKVNENGGYVESNENSFYPDGGNAPRTQVLRIRAFRIDLEPYDY